MTVDSGLRLLVVEDDERVQALAINILLGEGHAVLGVHTLEEARQALERGDSFDLIIADVVLPDGWAGALMLTVPRHRLLFTSGYDIADLVAAGESIEPDRFLQKPYTPKELLAKVRSVLAKFEGLM